jgi:hypothetical protein
MKCYNHSARDAVAICRACGKAVCQGCVLETEYGFACQQRCTKTLSGINEHYVGQAAHLKNFKRMNFLGSLFSIGIGLLFIYFSFMGYGVVYDLILLLGAGFTLYGVVAQLVNMIIFLKSKNNKPDC